MLVNFVHSPNACRCKSTSPFDKVTEDKFLQPSNAQAPISVTLSGITTITSLVLFAKALSPIFVTVYPSILVGITRLDE